MDIFTEEYAHGQDQQDPLHRLREFFLMPSKMDLTSRTLAGQGWSSEHVYERSIYLCGNSLGLQPTLTRKYMQQYLETWATRGVYGHFKEIVDSNLAPWLHVDSDVAIDMAEIVGALPSEVAVMQTLTANLHLMMASFYAPTKARYKIIIEGKAFPSDHYAVESHIRHHNIDAAEAMIIFGPESEQDPTISTATILKVIDDNASQTALLLLPGVQFYTGQFFDMPTITMHAQSKGITVGWDLAHAVGNVPVQLHDWNVDFAVWCTYKYLNCGPGSIGGCFVHERHGRVTSTAHSNAADGSPSHLSYRPRLAGWWGSSKSSRFAMTNQFHPMPGAAGFQLSNPSVADTTAVRASMDVFKKTNMEALRKKSMSLTQHLADLLDTLARRQDQASPTEGACFTIITPRSPHERGAQLSILLKPGLLDAIMLGLEDAGVVVDERKPDVIRVAPAPLYNTYEDVYTFVMEFGRACEKARLRKAEAAGSIMVNGGREANGSSEIT